MKKLHGASIILILCIMCGAAIFGLLGQLVLIDYDWQVNVIFIGGFVGAVCFAIRKKLGHLIGKIFDKLEGDDQ